MAKTDIAGKGGNRRIHALLTEYGMSHQNGDRKSVV